MEVRFHILITFSFSQNPRGRISFKLLVGVGAYFWNCDTYVNAKTFGGLTQLNKRQKTQRSGSL